MKGAAISIGGISKGYHFLYRRYMKGVPFSVKGIWKGYDFLWQV